MSSVLLKCIADNKELVAVHIERCIFYFQLDQSCSGVGLTRALGWVGLTEPKSTVFCGDYVKSTSWWQLCLLFLISLFILCHGACSLWLFWCLLWDRCSRLSGKLRWSYQQTFSDHKLSCLLHWVGLALHFSSYHWLSLIGSLTVVDGSGLIGSWDMDPRTTLG